MYKKASTTIAVSERVHAALRFYAAMYGKGVSALADEALLRGLAAMVSGDPATVRAAAADRELKAMIKQMEDESSGR